MVKTVVRDGGGRPALDLQADTPWDQRIEGTRVVYGPGRLGELGRLAGELAGRRALVVSDRGIEAAGHAERALESLEAAGLEVAIFTDVDENPSEEHVEAGVAAARGIAADLLVAVGGGSPMDCAKGINFVVTNGGAIADYEGFGHTTVPLLPAIGVPTTAGTGSEAQSYALIADAATHRKMACGAPDARFRAVILDPSLTDSLPRDVAAAAGLDAVSHAVESYVTRRRGAESSRLAATAWRLLTDHLPTALERPGDHTLWGTLQIAALLAGAAIERSMLGAAHACANPLTQCFDVVHGVAVALMLPHVVRFNAASVGELYAELLAPDDPAADTATAGGRLAGRLEELRDGAGLPATLGQLGIAEPDLEQLAERASRQWTLNFNPREASRDDLLQLYRHAL